MRRHGNAVVYPYVHDVAPNTLDDAKRFMADHHPFAATKAPFVDVQVGAANCGGR
jgi:cytochrome c peroxidase